MHSRRKVLWLFLFLLWGATAYVGGRFWLTQKNTLETNGRWEVSKLGLADVPMGAKGFLSERNTLYRHRLNLGYWHGHQQVMSMRSFKNAEMRAEWKAFLKPGSHLTFLIRSQAPTVFGVRLSRSKDFPNIVYSATPEGEILEREALSIPLLSIEKNRMTVRLTKDKLHIEVNGASQVIDRQKVLPQQIGQYQVGFKGSYESTRIDDVRIFEGENLVLKDSFDRSEKNISGISLVFGIVLLLNGLVFLAVRARARLNRNTVPIFSLANITVLLSVSAFYGADFFYFSWLYPEIPEPEKRTIHEKIHYRTMKKHQAKFRTLASRNQERVIFLVGTSQLFGEGAVSENKKVKDYLESRLKEGDRRLTQVVNLSIKASTGRVLFETFQRHWREFSRPGDVMVVSLSNNDGPTEEFEKSLADFATENKKSGMTTIFVTEPNDVMGFYNKSWADGLKSAHKIIRRVAKKYDVQVIEMQAHIDKHYDAGLLWWDKVHMSSYGQQVFADHLYTELNPYFK